MGNQAFRTESSDAALDREIAAAKARLEAANVALSMASAASAGVVKEDEAYWKRIGEEADRRIAQRESDAPGAQSAFEERRRNRFKDPRGVGHVDALSADAEPDAAGAQKRMNDRKVNAWRTK